jgi:hypothetical protein
LVIVNEGTEFIEALATVDRLGEDEADKVTWGYLDGCAVGLLLLF